MNTILDYLELHANLQGDREFLILQDERLTFAELATRVQRLAGVLRARGVGPGDRVVLYLARRTRYLTAYMATMAAGAIPVHLYPERPTSYVDFAATHTGAGLVITDQEQVAWSSFPHPLLHYPDLSDVTLPRVWPGPCSDAAREKLLTRASRKRLSVTRSATRVAVVVRDWASTWELMAENGKAGILSRREEMRQ